jgi:hypothetical protein
MSAKYQSAPGSHARFALIAPWLMLMALSSCEERKPPPASFNYGELPVSGTWADARRAGFKACIATNVDMRCRREGVSFEGRGPFSGAVDLVGGDGGGGFDHVTLWHKTDQSALVGIVSKLRVAGWSECLTPVGNRWGGQAIYQHQGSPIFISMDLSYWSIRRLMVYRASPATIPRCRS